MWIEFGHLDFWSIGFYPVYLRHSAPSVIEVLVGAYDTDYGKIYQHPPSVAEKVCRLHSSASSPPGSC